MGEGTSRVMNEPKASRTGVKYRNIGSLTL